MLLSFVDVFSSNVFINPEYVVAVFTAQEGDHEGKTVISLINGNAIVNEDLATAVGVINGAK